MTTTSSSSSSYTCASCLVRFPDGDAQREHYRSDWHRFNLRRKVADLPPLAYDSFTKKMMQMMHEGTLSTPSSLSSSTPSSSSFECLSCRKKFASDNVYQSHLRSRKHLAEMEKNSHHASSSSTSPHPPNRSPLSPHPNRSSSSSSNSDYIQEDEKDMEALLEAKMKVLRESCSPLRCFFCNACPEAQSAQANLQQMITKHHLYLPDAEYLVDLEGLMGHLAERIWIQHGCLHCHHPFGSVEAVRKHMADKGHGKIRFDEVGFDDLADYYDYDGDDSEGKGDYEDIVVDDDGDSDYEDIDDDDDEQEDSFNDDGAHVISPDETEMILASGARIGHRAYRHFYRQNLHSSMAHERESRRIQHERSLMSSSSIDDDDDDGDNRTSRRDLMVVVAPPHHRGQLSQRHLDAPAHLAAANRQFRSDQQACIRHTKRHDLAVGERANGLQTYYRQQWLQ